MIMMHTTHLLCVCVCVCQHFEEGKFSLVQYLLKCM